MTNSSSNHADLQRQLQINQQGHKKTSMFKHRAVLHLLVGLVFFGVFMTSFNQLEVDVTSQFDLFVEETPAVKLAQVPKTINLTQKHGKSIYAIEGKGQKNSLSTIRVNRGLKRNSTYFKPKPKFSKQEIELQVARRAKQIAALDRQAAINEKATKKALEELNKQRALELLAKQTSSEIKPKTVDLSSLSKSTLSVDKPTIVTAPENGIQSGKKVSISDTVSKTVSKIAATTRVTNNSVATNVALTNVATTKAATTKVATTNIATTTTKTNAIELKLPVAKTQVAARSLILEQPSAENLRNSKIKKPIILSGNEIEKLKQDVKNQAEVFAAEQTAPMPNIHAGNVKGEFVDALLAQVTAQAHDTELGWSAGNGKSSTIRRQVISLDKLNGFTIVDGKIATKETKVVGDRILMANIKVPAPLKRPKYIPKPKAKIITTSRTSLTCLTTALYHEVRGESRAGQLAVAEVINARRKSRSYPNSFCGVIYQNATKRNRCQFSFACDGKTDLPRDLKTWKKMQTLAGDFLAGRASAANVRGATHYHTTKVSPKWRWSMKRLGRIGAHIFYKDPRAKT